MHKGATIYKQNLLLKNLIALSLILFANPFFSYAQENGAVLFDDYCADCHSIGEGEMKGPDLLGVEQRYDNNWLLNFIKSSKSMIANGDPQAVAIFEKYNKSKMPDTDLSLSEIQNLIEFIKSFNVSAAKEEAAAANESSSSSGKTTQAQARTSPSDPGNQQEINTKMDDFEGRLEDIEQKLDIILEYHKKSLSARITDEEIEKGRKLFEGEVRFTDNAPVCASCHNTYEIDTLNWNPSALDVAMAFSHKNNADMADLIINPVSEKMKSVLDEHELTNDEIFYLTAFLQSVERTGLKVKKKWPTELIVFLGLVLLIVISFVDLMSTKFIKPRSITFIIILASIILAGNMVYKEASKIGISQNYAPDQPIKFSHRIHVTENRIECLFCHNSPEFSRESGIPTTNVCMICHNKIKTGVKTGQFEINKIVESFETEKPIEWVKVHNLPDHVFFSHAQHVSVGKIKCQTCHGKIEEMDITRQFSDLSMGWCVQCHRESKVQFKENNYYSEHWKLLEDLESGKIKEVTADKIGANDCQKCHY